MKGGLARFAGRKALVFMDVEGAEEHLLNPEAFPALRSFHVIVECHYFPGPNIGPGEAADLLGRRGGSLSGRVVGGRDRPLGVSATSPPALPPIRLAPEEDVLVHGALRWVGPD